jgi:hypothetical protein
MGDVGPLPPGPPSSRVRCAMGITSIIKREATIEELLSDPMMSLLFSHNRITADAVRDLIRGVRERLAKARADETEQQHRPLQLTQKEASP